MHCSLDSQLPHQASHHLGQPSFLLAGCARCPTCCFCNILVLVASDQRWRGLLRRVSRRRDISPVHSDHGFRWNECYLRRSGTVCALIQLPAASQQHLPREFDEVSCRQRLGNRRGASVAARDGRLQSSTLAAAYAYGTSVDAVALDLDVVQPWL